MSGTFSTQGETRNAYRILVGQLEGKRQTERPRWGSEPETEVEDRGGFRCTSETSYSGRGVCSFSQSLQGSVETQP